MARAFVTAVTVVGSLYCSSARLSGPIPAPAPAPMAAVAPSSAEASPPASLVPTNFDKSNRPMPEQGFDEHSDKWVQHSDFNTQVEDWHHERSGRMQGESDADSTSRICQQSTDLWCRLFLRDRHRSTMGPRTIVRKEYKTNSVGGAESQGDIVVEPATETPAVHPSKDLADKDLADKAPEEDAPTGPEKGLKETVKQANQAADGVSDVLPLEGAKKGGTKTVEDAKKAGDKMREAGSGDGSWFPPGMLPRSKKGGSKTVEDAKKAGDKMKEVGSEDGSWFPPGMLPRSNNGGSKTVEDAKKVGDKMKEAGSEDGSWFPPGMLPQ